MCRRSFPQTILRAIAHIDDFIVGIIFDVRTVNRDEDSGGRRRGSYAVVLTKFVRCPARHVKMDTVKIFVRVT